MNAAFAVSGSFVLGGQLAFIASVEPPSVVSAFIAAKLVGGICAAAARHGICTEVRSWIRGIGIPGVRKQPSVPAL